VWRKPVKDGLYEYQAVGLLNGVAPETCHRVYSDLAYRKRWDDHMKRWSDVPGLPNGVHWVVKYPWPLSDRDYVYTRVERTRPTAHGEAYVTLANAATAAGVPPKSGVVRVKEYRQTVVFLPAPGGSSGGPARTKVYLHYFDNPGGSIPTSVMQSVVHSILPTFAHNFVNGAPRHAGQRGRRPPATDARIAELERSGGHPRHSVQELREVSGSQGDRRRPQRGRAAGSCDGRRPPKGVCRVLATLALIHCTKGHWPHECCTTST